MSEAKNKTSIADSDASLELLARVSQAFASSLDLEESLKNAVTQITHYMHAEAASVFLLDEDGESLVCRASAGPVPIDGFRIGIDQGVLGLCVRENRVQFIRDVSDEPNFAGFVDDVTGFQTRSVLCAPLVLKGRPLGALEVLNKSGGDGLFDAGDSQMLQVLAACASLVIHNARMAAELVGQERLHRELELAREIQSNLLPPVRDASFPIAGVNVSALEVSGDFYDFFELADGRIAFNLGDVSGKGMNAALLMAKTSSLLHCLGRDIADPAALLEKVNSEVCESATRGMFVTLVTGIFEPASGLVQWANAGHQPPLYRSESGVYEEIPATAPPIGILPGQGYENQSLSLRGGSLYVCSDGVTEGTDDADRPLQVSGLKRLIDSYLAEPVAKRVDCIVSQVNAGQPGRADDVTLLVVDHLTDTGQGRHPRLCFKAVAEGLTDVRDWVHQELDGLEIDQQTLQMIILAVNEACMNVIQHGYKGDPSGEMVLEILDNDGELAFHLTDFATPVDPKTVKHRDLEDIRPGGLGVYFIDEIMDSHAFSTPESGQGNLLIMKKRYRQGTSE